MPNGHDREWVRLLLTLDGFRARYREWPTRILLSRGSLDAIRNEILTPEAFLSVSEKIDLVHDENARFVAEGEGGRRFKYGEQVSHAPDIQAEVWLEPVMHFDESW